MRLRNVDLNLFIVFETIYTERNLTRAAEVLCITQPAVSNALNRLRKTFNDQLFVRTPSAMVPTPVAENIITRVREALQLMGTSLAEADQFKPTESKKNFVISMNDIAENILLVPLMTAIQEQAPGVSLESFVVPRQEVSKELAAGTIDFALDLPSVSVHQLCAQRLKADRYVCAVRHDHPLVDNELTLEQFLELSHVHVSSRRRGHGYIDRALNRLGYTRKIQLRLRYHQSVAEIISKTDLALTLPLGLGQKMGLKLLELPIELEPVKRSPKKIKL